MGEIANGQHGTRRGTHHTVSNTRMEMSAEPFILWQAKHDQVCMLIGSIVDDMLCGVTFFDYELWLMPEFQYLRDKFLQLIHRKLANAGSIRITMGPLGQHMHQGKVRQAVMRAG